MADTDISGASAAQIVERCNMLAREFYSMQGYQVPEDFKFYEAHHPAERACWQMAVKAYDHITFTEVEECLAEVQEDGGGFIFVGLT